MALEQDNAAVITEQSSLATEMQTLRQYAFMAASPRRGTDRSHR